jgi:two-component system, response regulator
MTARIILLVEDDPRDEELTMRALVRSKVESRVVFAHDGVEALDFLFGQGSHSGRDVQDMPALVVLDLKLPRMNGIDVLKRIRADPRTRLIPAVILTSSGEERDRLEGYSSGANSYVRKPLEYTEFASAIAQLGVYWLVINQPPPPPPIRAPKP